jgi:hypothetical protein
MTRTIRQSIGKALGVVLLISWCCVISVEGQEFRGLIIGQVTDPHGAVVPNATVTAVREGTQQKYTAQTNGGGNFSIPYLQPGVYSVLVEAAGFKKAVRTALTVDVAGKVNLNIALEVGSVSETVTVQAEAALINTADASGGTVMDPEKVQNLPLNGRQIYMLLQLTPGVRFTQTTFGPAGFSGTRGWDENNQYVINGVPGTYNQFTLNGAPITQQTSTNSGSWEIAPNVDAVQEFKIMKNTYDAQYGRAGGGSVNTIIRSGAKKFHGTAFDFWRNKILDANRFELNQVGTPRQPHNQHQFGGTVGGPIPKLRNTFFFFSFEGWREVLPVGIVQSTPAADVRPQADGSVNFQTFFTQQLAGQLCNGVPCYNPNGPSAKGGIYDPLTCAVFNSDGKTCKTRARFQWNGKLDVIPPNRISPIGLKILSLFPLPNNPGAGEFDNFTGTNPGRYTYNQPIIRIDHTFSEKTQFYGMYAYWAGTEFRNTQGFDGPAMRGNINTRSNRTVVLDLTHTFTPTLFGDMRVSFNRTYNTTADGLVATGQAKLSAADLGLKMPVDVGQITTVSRKWAPTISVGGGYPQIIGNSTNQSTNALMYETYDFAPSVTLNHARHSFHYGGEMLLNHDIPGFILGNPNGSFNFSADFTRQTPGVTNLSDGANLANLLLGYPSGGSVDFSYDVYEYYSYFSGYVQDDFKVRRNLTLNLGLRWDVELSPQERYYKLNAGFDYNAINPITDQINFPGGNTLPNGAAISNPVKGGFRFSSKDLKPYDTQWNHWQPRFGLAWALNPKTVLRGGWGIFTATARELGGNTTWTQTTSFQSFDPVLGSSRPSGYFNTGIPYPDGVVLPVGNTLGLLSGVGIGQSFDQRNRKIPSIQQYSFGVQRQVPGRIVVAVSYVGSHTRDLRVGTQMNHLTPAQFAQCHQDPNFCNQLVPNPYYWGNLKNLSALPPSFVSSYKASSMGSLQNVPVKLLMLPYPQFFTSLFSNTEPVGWGTYNALEATVERRFSGGGPLIKGLSFITSFTWSRTMLANSFLNSGALSSSATNFGGGLQDTKPVYAISGTDRTLDLAFSGIWELPVGKGGLFFKNAKGALGQLVNDWTLDWIFTHDSGTPINIPNGYIFNCPGHPSYLPDPGRQNYGEWLYNENPSCFTPLNQNTSTVKTAFTATTIVPRVSYIRAPWAPQLALAVSKQFRIREAVKLQVKAEAFNVTNTPIFGGPNTGSPDQPSTPVLDAKGNPRFAPGSPGYCNGYGCIGSNQLNFPRQIQLSLKLLF